MAKSKSFFGLRRGSTKSLTFSILDGQQITKDRVVSVKNPQTSLQMVQRVVFATVNSAAEKMLPIIGISQQGVRNQTAARRQFVSINTKLLRAAALRMRAGGRTEAAFAPKGNQQLIPNSYEVSHGSLYLKPQLVPKTTAEDGRSFGADTLQEIGTLATIPYGTYTGADLWRLLFGLQPGDQLTFPQIYGGYGTAQEMFSPSGSTIDLTKVTQFCAPRIVLYDSLENDEIVNVSQDSDILDVLGDTVSAMKRWVDGNLSWFDFEHFADYMSPRTSTGGVEIVMETTYDVYAINNDDPLLAIGCIRSHKNASSGKWEYSTSNLVCLWKLPISDQNYFGFTLQNAAETYLKSTSTDADGNFLQTGTDDTIVPQDFQ